MHEFTANLASQLVGSDISVMLPSIVIPPIVFGLSGCVFDEFGFTIPGNWKKHIAVFIGGLSGVLIYGPTIPFLAQGLIAGYITTKGVERFSGRRKSSNSVQTLEVVEEIEEEPKETTDEQEEAVIPVVVTDEEIVIPPSEPTSTKVEVIAEEELVNSDPVEEEPIHATEVAEDEKTEEEPIHATEVVQDDEEDEEFNL